MTPIGKKLTNHSKTINDVTMDNQQVRHSVYIAYDDTSYYIGYKSFKTLEQFNKYKTSSSVKSFDKKIILAICDSHSEALQLEDLFITQCINDAKCVNKVTNSMRMESYINWCKNNKELSSNRGHKAVSTRKERYNLSDLSKKSHKTCKELKVGIYSDLGKLKTKIRNKLMFMQLAVEHGRISNGRIVSENTFNQQLKLSQDLKIKLNPIDIKAYRNLNTSNMSLTYGVNRSIKSLTKKIKTGINSYGNKLSEKQIENCRIKLIETERKLQRLFQTEVPSSDGKWVPPINYYNLGEDIVCSLSKDKAALRRLGINES